MIKKNVGINEEIRMNWIKAPQPTKATRDGIIDVAAALLIILSTNLFFISWVTVPLAEKVDGMVH